MYFSTFTEIYRKLRIYLINKVPECFLFWQQNLVSISGNITVFPNQETEYVSKTGNKMQQNKLFPVLETDKKWKRGVYKSSSNPI